VTTRQLLLEVERTIGQLESTLGHRTNLFRPPRGAVTLSKLIGLWRAGQTVVLWNADPGDCRMASASQLEQWGQVRGLRAGDIVLLHDDLPHAAAALPAMVRQARSRGLRFAAISPKPAIPQACLTNGGLGPQVKATGPEALCNPCGEGRTATR
jgi:peptidoglycan/xylan/chitin deacetylase (PgdA/CDA1 family)